MRHIKYVSFLVVVLAVFSFMRSASGQSFAIQSGAPVHIEGACGDDIYDSTLVIRNLTNAPLKMGVSYKEIGYRFSISKPIIPALGTAKIVIYFNGAHQDSSISKTTAKFFSGTDTVPVPITVVMKPYASCAEGWQDVYMTGIKVGETRCATYWGRNTTDKPLSFFGASSDVNSGFTVTHLVPVPYVILPGEDLPLFDVCFTASSPNQSAWDRLNASFSEYGTNTDHLHPAPLDIRAYSEVDSILQRPCFELLKNKDIFGPALLDGDSFDTVYVRNNRYEAMSLDNLTFTIGDAGSFSIVESFPQVLQPLEKRAFTMKFSPRTTSPIVKYRFATQAVLSYTGSASDKFCNGTPLDIVALAMEPTSDTTASPLIPDKDYYLGMTGKNPSFSKDFYFVNNGSANVKIVAVGLTNPSPEFTITNIQPTSSLPFTLTPGGKMTVSVLFTPSKPGVVFYNQLVITTEAGLLSQTYTLEGLQLPTNGVGENKLVSSTVLAVYPNPASESFAISVDGAREITHAEMYDMLGATVLSTDIRSASPWTMDLHAYTIADGTYILRIQGISSTGEAFVSSKKVQIQK